MLPRTNPQQSGHSGGAKPARKGSSPAIQPAQGTDHKTAARPDFGLRGPELGGSVMFLSGADTQLGRGEPIKDTARVLGRMVHGAVIRTYSQEDVEEFAKYSGLPTINARSAV